jgi:Ca2+-binding RTX toxin-like protein
VGYTFSEEEKKELIEARAQCPAVLGSNGNFVPLYDKLSSIIGRHLDDAALDAETKSTLQSAKLWLDIASGANGGYGVHSAFIRGFTVRQGELREGVTFTNDQVQLASNGVALNLWNNLQKDWTVPTIDKIAATDGSAIGELLYRPFGEGTTATIANSAWTGTLAFSLLGGTTPFETWRLLTAGDLGSELEGQHGAAQFNRLNDLRDVLYAVDAFNYGLVEGLKAGPESLALYWVYALLVSKKIALLPQDLIAQLNVNLASGTISPFVKTAAAGTPISQHVNTIANEGVFGILDMMRRAINGNEVAKTQSVDEFKINAKVLFHDLDLLGASMAIERVTDAMKIAAAANKDFASLVTLESLSLYRLTGETSNNLLATNQFDLHARWKADQSLTTDDRDSGKANFTETYLEDRASMLSWINKRNVDGLYQTDVVPGDNMIFFDAATKQRVYVGWSMEGALAGRKIHFGGKDNDELIGGEKNDKLYGGAGADRLTGGAGSDYLEGNDGADELSGGDGVDVLLGGKDNDRLDGGAGHDFLKGGDGDDTYVSQAGIDIVRDSDGRGHVEVSGAILNGGSHRYGTLQKGGLWEDAATKVSYMLQPGEDGSDYTLTIRHGTGVAQVQHWHNGDLGIRLEAERSLSTAGAGGGTISADMQPRAFEAKVTFEIISAMMVKPNVRFTDIGVWGVSGPDYIAHNFDLSQRAQLDQLRLLSSGQLPDDTYAYSITHLDVDDEGKATSADIVYYRFDGLGNPVGGEPNPGDWEETQQSDELYGSEGSDTMYAGRGGDFVQAGEGNDIVIGGSNGNYEGYTDILNGGDGNDVMFADDEVALSTLSALEAQADSTPIVGPGDWVYGEKGDDKIVGSRADDALFGGAGKDMLFGGAGQDVLNGDQMRYSNGGPGSLENRIVIQKGSSQNPIGSTFYELDVKLPAGGLLLHTHGVLPDGDGSDDILSGGAGDDRLHGGLGNDVLFGGADNDVVTGDAGDDYILGGDGDDALTGEFNDGRYADGSTVKTHGRDYIDGGAGKDFIQGEGGDDVLLGGADGDKLWGDATYGLDAALEGNDLLDGGAGDDQLMGQGGNDIMIGGRGDDVMNGGDGDDVYIINKGDGVDHIMLSAGKDKIVFGSGVTKDSIKLGLGSLLISYGDAGNALHIEGFNPDDVMSTPVIESFEFADGSSLDYAQLLERGFDIEGAGQVRGTNVDDRLTGSAGDDTLTGGDGDDTLDGREGKDVLDGGRGSNTYLFGRGDGTDVVTNIYQQYDDSFVIKLKSSVGVADVSLARVGDDLALSINGTADKLTIERYFVEAPGTHMQVQFENGTVWNQADLLARMPGIVIEGTSGDDQLHGTLVGDTMRGGSGNDSLFASDGDDRLYGDGGNDTLAGQVGNDVYYFANGTGHDIVDDGGDWGGDIFSDAIVFAAGVDPADVRVSRQPYNELLLEWNNGADSVALANWFSLSADKVRSVRFADGTEWNSEELSNRAVKLDGSDDSDVLHGSQGQDWLQGMAGNDELFGNGGNDVLQGGDGNDQLGDGQGNNLLEGGAGDDWFGAQNAGGVQCLVGGKGSDLLDLSGKGLILLNAGDGADRLRLDGAPGFVLSIGGVGAETMSLSAESNAVVLHFGDNDRIRLDGLLHDELPAVTLQVIGADVRLYDLTAMIAAFRDSLPGGEPVLLLAPMAQGAATMSAGAEAERWPLGPVLEANLKAVSGTQAIGGDLAYRYAIEGKTAALTLAEIQQQMANPAFGQALQNFSSGPQVLTGTAGDDNLKGGAAADTLSGGLGNDILDGGAGNDRLDGGAGRDTMTGGSGDDTYLVDDAADQVTELAEQGRDTVLSAISYTLGSNVEELRLTGSAAINGTGNALDNIILGNSGANQLAGGGGMDKLIGAAGNDVYTVLDAGTTVIEAANEGTDTVKASLSYTLGDNLENLTLSGSAAINGTGNAANNVLLGNSAANVLMGLDGDDILNGSAGADTLMGGTGNDTYVVSSTTAKVVEGSGEGMDTVQASINFVLADHVENLTLTGSGLARGYGNALDNVLAGSANANNLLEGKLGNDTLQGKAKNDVLRGDAGNDLLLDLGGKNIFDGGAGDDTLEGKDGNEVFIGGTGADLIRTGLGCDVIAFNGGDGVDTVIAGAGRDNTVSLGQGIASASLALQKSGNDLVLALGESDQLVFRDWYAASGNQSVARLQMIENTSVKIFDFQKLVDLFEGARQVDSTLTSWAFAGRLGDAYLSEHDAKALGGSAAYQYGKDGSQYMDFFGLVGEMGASGFCVEVQGVSQTIPLPGMMLG